ncbi:MAG: hypothetical protein ABIS21_06740 [Acidimicrobiales bacterium]
MVLWFAGLALVIVWQVFRDTAIDYRLIVAGVLLPDLTDAALGGARILHTLVASVVLMTLVMVGTRGRRGARRRLLALPIGTFLHLVLDAMWSSTTVFWWPVFGASFGGAGLPSLSRPVALIIMQELVGLLALAWWWRRFGLHDVDRRRTFLRTGRLGRDLVA